LPNRTDEELGVLAATYDPSVSNEAHYTPKIKDVVDRFRRQVQPIGPPRSTNVTDPIDRRVTSQTGIVWAGRGREHILTQVTLTQSSLDPGSRMYFQTFIDNDLRTIAEDKAAATQPRGVQEVPEGNIIGFPNSIPSTAARR
jgi:hypothetical protein